MKKIFLLMACLLCLSVLTGCGEEEPVAESPVAESHALTETPAPTESPALLETPAPVDGPFAGGFVQTEFCVGDFYPRHSTVWPEGTVLPGGLWLFQVHLGDEFDPEASTLLRVYDPHTNQFPAQLEVPGWPDVDVNGDKIILREGKELYWVSPDFSYTSERITLPDFLFEDVFMDGQNCGRPIYNYTVSSDLTKLVYCCRVRGIELYDLETGETTQLLPPKQDPFFYDEDFDWWMTPYWLNFLPGDRELAFVTQGNVFYVVNIADGSVWSQKVGTLADAWGSFWHAHSAGPFPCLTETSGGYLFQYVDLNQKTVSEPREFLQMFYQLVYNDLYFAYPGDDGIMVCDLATLTPRLVLPHPTGDYQWSDFQVLGVTEEGQVLFHWRGETLEGQSEWIDGLTDPLPLS